VLPKKAASAAAVLRSRMTKEDGDGDGVVSDIEMLRALYSITPGLTPDDCGFLIKFLSKRCATGGAEGAGGEGGGVSRGMHAGISASAVADWFTAQPGGLPPSARKEPPPGEERAGDPERAAADAQKFLQFRAAWEAKHGAPARKEAAMDAELPAEGPTWTRANPAAFKVLHLASPAPKAD
jgi:hypothetical protein